MSKNRSDLKQIPENELKCQLYECGPAMNSCWMLSKNGILSGTSVKTTLFGKVPYIYIYMLFCFVLFCFVFCCDWERERERECKYMYIVFATRRLACAPGPLMPKGLLGTRPVRQGPAARTRVLPAHPARWRQRGSSECAPCTCRKNAPLACAPGLLTPKGLLGTRPVRQGPAARTRLSPARPAR